jgi:hypothetical protein
MTDVGPDDPALNPVVVIGRDPFRSIETSDRKRKLVLSAIGEPEGRPAASAMGCSAMGDDRNTMGSGPRQLTAVFGYQARVAKGLPVQRRHVAQWQ